MTNTRLFNLCLFCLLLCSPAVKPAAAVAQAKPDETAATGTIAGQVLDTDGQPVSRSVSVFLCDGTSGYPISAADHQPLRRQNISVDLNDFVHATARGGRFRFDDVPAGRYRLVAQSWDGTDDIPGKDAPRDNWPLRLHGTATLAVPADEIVSVTLQSPGSQTVYVQTDPDEGNAFVFATTKEPVGDFVLGTTAWQDFGTDVLGATHLKAGDVVIHGLPDDQQIWFCYLNYDNNAGVGGGMCHTARNRLARINVYATWSNGKHDPPVRLLPLVEELESAGTPVADLLGLPDGNPRQQYTALQRMVEQHGLRKVDVGNAGEWTVVDVVAANTYRSLRKSHADRRQRNRPTDNKP